jgi:rRNA maturation endonuclease Nob1
LEKIFILIIAIAISIFVALPFFRRRVEEIPSRDERDTLENAMGEKLRKLGLEKESLYGALKEIDFDYDLGKLSREDYDELQKNYKMQAAAILKEIDYVKMETPSVHLMDAAGEEIELMRGGEGIDENEVEREILMARKSRVKNKTIFICSGCEKQIDPGDKFCPNCGKRLNENRIKQVNQ